MFWYGMAWFGMVWLVWHGKLWFFRSLGACLVTLVFMSRLKTQYLYCRRLRLRLRLLLLLRLLKPGPTTIVPWFHRNRGLKRHYHFHLVDYRQWLLSLDMETKLVQHKNLTYDIWQHDKISILSLWTVGSIDLATATAKGTKVFRPIDG